MWQFLTIAMVVLSVASTLAALLALRARSHLRERLQARLAEGKQMETALQKEPAFTKALIDNLPNIFYVQDESGRFVLWNKNAEKVLEYSSEEIAALAPSSVVAEEDRARAIAQSHETLSKGHGSAEIHLVAKSGTKLPYLLTATRTAIGDKVYIVGTGIDITDRKLLEQQFHQAQKIEALGRLAGGVAHDFNNLLTIISGYGQLLRERLSCQNLEYLQEILKAGERATSLTRQLLAFSRLQILSPIILDLNAVVADLEKMLRRLIEEDIELATRRGPELGLVKADPGQIEQVILNLAVNARDAMPQGGKLTIETANVYLDNTHARTHPTVVPGPHVMVAVTDTGVGMDADTQKRIFEPFFTTKERGQGSGLGLATVYGIVKQSGGSIWVYSELGRGTTFKVYFPRVDEAVSQEKADGTSPEALLGRETILVAEDEQGVRSLVCATLKAKGYRILEALGPFEALSLMESHAEPIHLLLTDLIMPKMSGRELADSMLKLHPEAKVLFMSGYTDDAVVRHGIMEASASFLQKPFVPSALAQKVRKVLDAIP